MAQANLLLINALRQTAENLRKGSIYAWGNHGSCNCGNLLQVVTQLSKEEILYYAHQGIGEWTELSTEYCGVTNAPIGLLLKNLEEIGLTPTDIHDLEYLTNRKVLNNLPNGFAWLQKNNREDVIIYFETYAKMLEEELIEKIPIQQLIKESFELVY
jgi:hypothetical protein